MPKRIDYQPNEVYRFAIEIDGDNLIYLQQRADKLKRNLTNESSFLINELIHMHRSSSVSKLTSLSDRWTPENQSEVTEQTLKTKS
jgi:hypothetical protein